jgi:hypothetical protein
MIAILESKRWKKVKRIHCILIGMIIVLLSCQSIDGVSDSTPSAYDLPVTELAVDTTPSVEPAATMELISEPGVSSIPQPNYLGSLWPEPGETLSLSEYEALAPSLAWGATVPGICFGHQPLWLLVPGDFPTTEEWLDRVHLVVDRRKITEYHSIMMTDSEGAKMIDPGTDQALYKAPDGSPFGMCYAASLGVGRHTVTFVAKKTSGEEVTYTWQFTITE